MKKIYLYKKNNEKKNWSRGQQRVLIKFNPQ